MSSHELAAMRVAQSRERHEARVEALQTRESDKALDCVGDGSFRIAKQTISLVREITPLVTPNLRAKVHYTGWLAPVPPDSAAPLIDGDVPSPIAPPSGCRFHTRCPIAIAKCREMEPTLGADGDDHEVEADPEECGRLRVALLSGEHRAEHSSKDDDCDGGVAQPLESFGFLAAIRIGHVDFESAAEAPEPHDEVVDG